MRKEHINLSTSCLECYFPDTELKNPILDVYISLGIPRDGPNSKSYIPGTLFDKLLAKLAEKNMKGCIVGVPGMGGSSGDTFETTLNQRAEHISEIIKQRKSKKIWLMGYSMGGPILLLLLKNHQHLEKTVGLTFVAPAAYPMGSENQCFGVPFKQAIEGSSPDAVWYTDYLATLPSTINCHLLLAEQDKTIPPFISEAYQKALRARQTCRAHTQFTQIPKASHCLLDGDWDSNYLAQQMLLCIENL